ncbi:Nucleotide-binding universal stress protein, UspA family [Roseateles sp. YR242]|uniref:universal stress protein n=1 Tax=Roseateles sp. YR242 TaxID=1855305 RepID=UPI0008C52381|nr:universal stress protein [Roseateles sp. YR242]SEK36644.1 Nucleotide-binding universal stress protein, UspA family [Roseateles sp. YR242]
MYRKVLLAYDGSPPANAALAAAAVLLHGQPAELELVYVMYDLPLNVEFSDGAMLEASRSSQRSAAEAILSQATRHLAEDALPAQRTILDAGGRRTAEAIVEHAVREHAGLIVIGSHGRRGVSRALLGSDAELVARLSPVPVMIVKESGHAP